MNREIDALIAEKVMGWEWNGEHGLRFLIPPVGTPMRDNCWAAEWDREGRPHWLPKYSTDIAAAWTVVEKIAGDSQWSRTFIVERHPGSGRYSAFFHPNEDSPEYADTAPMAICLAALKAVGVEAPKAGRGKGRE